jgi:uncharacterized membrane protein
MISTQVAISFENATLYRNLQSANRLLEAKNKSLMELDQVKDQFLANTSHELRCVFFYLLFIYFYFIFYLFFLKKLFC